MQPSNACADLLRWLTNVDFECDVNLAIRLAPRMRHIPHKVPDVFALYVYPIKYVVYKKLDDQVVPVSLTPKSIYHVLRNWVITGDTQHYQIKDAFATYGALRDIGRAHRTYLANRSELSGRNFTTLNDLEHITEIYVRSREPEVVERLAKRMMVNITKRRDRQVKLDKLAAIYRDEVKKAEKRLTRALL